MSQAPETPGTKAPPLAGDHDAAAERIDVGAMHSPIMREQRDPRDGYEPIPLWLMVLFGVLLFWGGWYLATYSGGWRWDVLDEDPAARYAAPPLVTTAEDPLVLGKRLFSANCVSCHQADGQGIPGTYPPLAGSEWVLGDSARIVRILLHGLENPITVKGATYNGSMPNFGLKLKDEHIAAVLSYVRSQWGNDAPPISPADVAATRAATKDRIRPWVVSELVGVPNRQD